MASKRISGTDGQDDEFTRYCNGNIKGEDSSGLNGYDYKAKGMLNNCLDIIQQMYDAGLMDKPLAEPVATDISVSCEIVDSTTTSIYVGGEKRLTMVEPMYHLPDNSIHITNETRCEVGDGRIYEAGNKMGVPDSIYNKALARYEEMLATSLNNGLIKQH